MVTFAPKRFLALKKLFKILTIIALAFVGLLIIISILVNVTFVQNFLVSRVTRTLSNQLHTRVEIHHVDFQLFNKFVLEGAYVADQHNDTLLYADNLTVNVTNFFFFRNKTVLYYVGLRDAVVQLNRRPGDSTWNYQFILDALTSPAPSTTQKQEPNIDLRKIDIRNIRIHQADGWAGQDMDVAADRIAVDARVIDLRRHRLNIRSISLGKPLFVISRYKGTRPPRPHEAAPDDTASAPDSLQWNAGRWQLQLAQLRIDDGGFALIDRTEEHVAPYFDPQHIAVFGIDARLQQVRLDKDSVFADVSLQARERSGVEIKSLRCRFKLSPVEMEFADLDLETNRSHLKNYFTMQFPDGFGALGDFTHSVYMRANFEQADVASDDIAFFAPALESWEKNIRVNGQAYGTLNNLTGNDLDILAGGSTELKGHIKLRGLPDIDNTFIDFQAEELATTGRDLQRFVPSLQAIQGVDLNTLTRLLFTGSYTGFIHDFVAYGDFHTNLGNIHSDLNMKLGGDRQVAIYSGNLSAERFDLGQLLANARLGTITFSAKVDGSGLNSEDLNARINGTVDELYLNGYTYHHIVTDGSFDKKLFQGQLQVRDSSLDMDFSGLVDFNQEVPNFNFQAEVRRSDLTTLRLLKDSVTFSGKLDMDFAGDNIDNFYGDARLYDISLYKDKQRLALDTLVIHSRMDSSGKWLTVETNEIQGYLRGHYNLEQLPGAINHLLARYFPSRIATPQTVAYDERFSFGLQVGQVDSLVRSLLPGLGGLNDATVSGRLDMTGDSISIQAAVPELRYGHYVFRDIRLLALGRDTALNLQTDVGEVRMRDSLLFPSITLQGRSFADTSFIHIMSGGNNTLNSADLRGRVVTLADGYKIKILNSELVVNDKAWRITPDNEITLQKNAVTIYNFNIAHNEQRILLTSAEPNDSTPSFLIKLQDLNIADFSQFLTTDTRMEGIANGQIRVDDPMGRLRANGTMTATQLRINNDSLGTVQAAGSYDHTLSEVNWKLFKNDNPSENFSMQGVVGLSKKNNRLQGDFTLNHTDISLLGTMAGDFISEFKGYATGKVTLGGTTSAPDIQGAVRLDSVGVKVNYLGTYYTLSNETVQFRNDSIDIGSMTLHDKLGGQAVVRGTIAHHHFNDLWFNLSLTASNFEFMHTTAEDNPLYYGNVSASGRVDLTGPLRDMQMVVNATPQKGTHLYLPLSDAKDIGKHDFVVFKQYGTEMVPERSANDKANLNIRLNATMTPQARIDVIVDASTGDRISATGNGGLQMNIDLNGDFRMYGNYAIENGSYSFSFKGLFPRNFQINNGSSISWNGDPAAANVNIAAIYTVPGGANLYDLIAGEAESSTIPLTEEDQKLIRQREKVDVYLFLKGSLTHPDITYDIRLPEAGINAGSYAMSKLQQIKQSPNDLLTQVTGLLAFGQFIPPSSSNGNPGLLRSGGLSGAGQWVSSQMTGVLNNLFGSAFRSLGLNFNMNYNAYSALGDYGSIQRNDVQFNLSKSMFNNRVHIEVGPSIDWGRANSPGAPGGNSYFAGDFRFEYMITPDGRIRFIAFSRSNYDVLINQNLTRGGVGISYSREFDRLHEFFITRKERRQRDSLRAERIRRYMEEIESDSLLVPVPATLPKDSLEKREEEPGDRHPGNGGDGSA